MSSRSRPSEPAGYEVRVRAVLDDHWSEWFDGFCLSREDEGTTALRGAVTDQAELHGLLAKVRDLGVTLISVTSLEPVPDLPVRRLHRTGVGQEQPASSGSRASVSADAEPS